MSFSEWVQPDGTTWSIPTQPGFKFHVAHLVHAAQKSASKLLWQPAVSHYNGAGLHDGISHAHTMKVLYHCRKHDMYDRVAALETIMCAACWSPQRKYDAGLITAEENVCHLCHAHGCDDFHQFWVCPSLDGNEWPEISSSQQLVPKASEELSVLPCLWLRGLL